MATEKAPSSKGTAKTGPAKTGKGKGKPKLVREGVPADSPLAKFAKLGIHREADLILHLPLRYEDQTRLTPMAKAVLLPNGTSVQVQGSVVRHEISRRGRKTLLVELADETGLVQFRFFHFYPSQLKQFEPGKLIRAVGEIKTSLYGAEIVHPRYQMVQPDTPLPEALSPVYPLAAGITQAQLQKAIHQAVERATLREYLSAGQLSALDMLALLPALQLLHRPPAGIDLLQLQNREHRAWRRIIFDELLAQQLALRRARAARTELSAPQLTRQGHARRLLKELPFKLTQAQQRVWQEIAGDLARRQPMNRLLQGDVGSGKTVVAALAACVAVASGAQVALMAPTEILARQHAQKLTPWLLAIGLRVAYLSGSMKESEKRQIREQLVQGQIDLLVGTHALIEQGCEFARLGLSIVDEQHRFGVAQRLRLRSKALTLVPHQLMMSATPIPRTLAMSYYADLDVSVIDMLPPGRHPIRTRLVADGRRDEVVARVLAAALQGSQVYWVCPLIEESEALDLQTAMETFEQLSLALAPVTVGLVHGRLASAEKEATMAQFIAGEMKVLVATTVIEVGVDVPQASLMVIENAERFGMAQLHQLRGRVGRGSEQSTCVLLYKNPLSENARERLRALFETADGFEIARRDLQLRGPGEFLGARQSGLPLLRYGDLERDVDLLEAARDMATELQADPGETGAGAMQALLDRWFGGREDFLKA